MVKKQFLQEANDTLKRCYILIATQNEVDSGTDGEDDEKDGTRTQITHGTSVWTGTGTLHPDLQGLTDSQVLDDGRRVIWAAVVMHYGLRLVIDS